MPIAIVTIRGKDGGKRDYWKLPKLGADTGSRHASGAADVVES